MRKCADCGAEASDNSQFCRSCGAELEAEVFASDVNLCKSCQEPIESGERFCSNCGQPVSSVQESSQAIDDPDQAVDNHENNSDEPEGADDDKTASEPVAAAQQGLADTEDRPGLISCPKCSSQLSGDAVFCRNCGHNINLSRQATAAAAGQAVPAASYLPPPPPPAWSAGYSSQPAAPPKKKRKGLLIGLLIVLIAALLAGAIYLLAGRTIRRLILGNKATYLVVEGLQLKQDAADLAEWLADMGNKPVRPAAGGHNVEFNIDFNNNAAVMDPVMQSALENITWRSQILYDLEASPAQYYAKLDLLTASEPLLSIEGYYDQEQLIVGLPGIINQYLWAQRDTIDDYASDMGLDADETGQALGMLDLFLSLDMGIDEPAMQQSLFTLIDIMLSHIDQVDFTAKQDLSVGPVSGNYDRFTMTISDENTYLMMREILEVMRDDTEIFNLVSRMTELGQTIDPDSFNAPLLLTLEQWQQSIDLLIEELDHDYETAEPFTIVQDIYVDKNDQIFGRDLKILDQAGSISFRFENYRPESDDQAAVLMRITSESDVMEYRDIYQLDGAKRDGKLTMSNNNQLIIEIDYNQYEKAAVGSRSYIFGDFSIRLYDQNGDGSPTTIQYQSSLAGGQVVMKLGTPDLGSIQISYQEVTRQDMVMPSFRSDQLVDINDWQAMAGLMSEETMSELFRIINQLGFDPGMLNE